MASEALSDLRVLELGDFVSAPWCGKFLASMGAEVIKVEHHVATLEAGERLGAPWPLLPNP